MLSLIQNVPNLPLLPCFSNLKSLNDLPFSIVDAEFMVHISSNLCAKNGSKTYYVFIPDKIKISDFITYATYAYFEQNGRIRAIDIKTSY